MNLYVGNLPTTTTEDELKEIFVSFGEIFSTKIITDRETGQSRGFGFVEMSENAARNAITGLDGTEYEGKQIVVNEAREKRTNFNDRSKRNFR